MNGAFAQQAMQQQQYSGMIGQSGYAGDAAMGRGMNFASSVGGPLASGAMGMMGLDPMSMGLKAGMSAFGSGAGVGGALGAGAAVALPLMAGGAALGYAGNQMMSGAQQQQGLNQQLRQTFAFRNQHGGQGFQHNEMSAIGGLMREMSEQVGPGGEMASFKELAGLSTKMGQMGMMQGVRDVKEFSKRFKETVTALKTMATELNTTLEGALELTNAAKSSGVFGARGAMGFASMARNTSVSGGLALSEVTGAASIGSQISRSMGGLGRQGAMAGMRTIGQIGTAQQMGLLSEEDIYNTTGLTGAEGRQAYAASSMQHTAGFLQSGRGRRLLASVAGKDGSLDEGAVQQILTGGMSISETMKNDQSHLAKVGRANFIRNEGRLRGAAMERFGGFLPALQLKEWAESKGVDINNMDDRSMLFAQRQLGMGRDEVDSAIKMASAMPEILEQQRRDASRDQYFQKQSMARKSHGLEGVKQRFDQAKEHINSKLQKVGQDVFNAGSQSIDEFFNGLLDHYTETYSKDIDDKFQQMMGGGVLSAKAGRDAFGVGMKGFGGKGLALPGKMGDQDLAAQLRAGGSMSQGLTNMGEGAMAGAAGGALGGGLFGAAGGGVLGAMAGSGEMMRFLLHGESGQSKLRKAGFDINGMSSDQIRSKFADIDQVRRVASGGYDKSVLTEYGGEKGKWLSEAYAMGHVAGQGDDRIASFGQALAKHDQAAGDKFSKMTLAEKASYMASAERAQGIGGAGSLASNYGIPSDLLTSSSRGFRSAREENTALARSVLGDQRSFGEKATAVAVGGVGNLLTLGFATKAVGSFADSVSGGGAAAEQAAGEFLKSDKFRDLALRTFGGDKDVAAQARADISKELAGLSDEDKNNPESQVKQRLMAASSYSEWLDKNPNASAEDKEKFAASLSSPGRTFKPDELASMATRSMQTVRTDWEKNVSEISRRQRGEGKKELDTATNLGIYDAKANTLTADARKSLETAGGKDAARFASYALRASVMKSNLGGTTATAEVDAGILEKMQGEAVEQERLLDKMTVSQKRAVANALAGTEAGAKAGYSASVEDRFDKSSRRKGKTGAAAEALGLNLSKDQLKNIDVNSYEGMQKLLAMSGVGDKETLAAVQKGMSEGRKTASIISDVTSSKEFKDKQTAKKQGEQEANDPLAAAQLKAAEKSAKFLEDLVAIGKGTNSMLTTIEKNGFKNPEGK
jgi:hypothetical protein